MIDNLSEKHLLADRLNHAANDAGVKVVGIHLNNGCEIGTYFSSDVHVQVSLKKSTRADAEDNEHAAALLLDHLPELRLVRDSGLIWLRGESSGLTFDFYPGRGVCERVKVGERVVPAQPEHTEPIFEIRCPDPLRELEAAAS